MKTGFPTSSYAIHIVILRCGPSRLPEKRRGSCVSDHVRVNLVISLWDWAYLNSQEAQGYLDAAE